ncbi:MAG TPA: Ig-like domain-containing protein, partial [Thermoanaerobaculia bacterium]
MRILFATVLAALFVSASAFAQLPLVALSVTPERVVLEINEESQFTATATLAGGGIADLTDSVTWSSSNPGVATIDAGGRLRSLAAGVTVVSATYALLRDTANVEVLAPGPFAPDPSQLATALNKSELTSFADATSFLYTGATPVQTGVTAGTIVPLRAAVTRGMVRTRQGVPLGGVHVSILGHPELGSTYTRPDGAYDLAVNGGRTYVTRFSRPGYPIVQRTVYAPWQDYAIVEDVVMTRYDGAATVITAGATAGQSARGTPMSDTSGQRRATLLVPSGTTASMTLPDGSTSSLGQLTIRLTEYTIGANGPSAMPAALPPESGYTYCVELSADEAVNASATTVAFSKPLAFYLENFLGFPVGGVVPSGYYDRQRGAWIASDDGRVVKIVSENGGMADVDISGDDVADSSTALAGLGIDDEERRQLAALYEPGTSLWRVPVTHFTPFDLNWPAGNYYEIDPNSETNPIPPNAPPEWSETVDDPAECAGSIIRCDNQTLGETIPIAGTPFDLVYDSGRVHGRTAERKFRIQVSGPNTPSSVTNITARVEIAGVVTEQSFTPGTAQTMEFAWDGRDAYGRIATGAADAHVSVSYTYAAVYFVPTSAGRAFAQRSGVRFLAPRLARTPEVKTSKWTVPLGGLRAESAHLGGWTFSPHQLYDYSRRALLMGNGRQRTADLRELGKYQVSRVAGRLACCDDGSGVATRTAIDAPYQVAVGADGTLYLNEQRYIRRVTPDGMIERIAGTGTTGYSGDGGPAVDARINARRSLVVGDDGSIYFPDWNNYRVRRISPAGIITTVAGTGEPPEFGVIEENVPATQARVNPQDVAVAPDGTLYIADRYKYIRRISPDGMIHTVTGAGTRRDDGAPAREFRVNFSTLEGLALAPDGSLYFAEEGTYGAVLRKIGPDGLVRTVAGAGSHCGYAHSRPYDGPAVDACLNLVWFLRSGPDGSLVIADQNASRVRMLTPDGMMRTIAGNGLFAGSDRRDSGVATGERIRQPFGAAFGPDGNIYFTEVLAYGVVWKLAPLVQRFVDGETYIPSADGSELYFFSGSRHLRTVDALTGGTRLEFSYDSQQRLVGITDLDGNLTAIERTAAGNVTAIVAPGGQRTEIVLDANGYLRTVSDPAGRTHTLTHTGTGLLTALQSPRLLTHTFTYNADGRLEKDTAPDGRSLSLTRAGFGDDWTVTSTTTLGRTLETRREREVTSTRHISILTSGLQIDRSGANGLTTVTTADGVVTTSTPRGDPRFGIATPVVGTTMRFPSGRTFAITRGRSVTLTNPNDALSLATQTDTVTVAGRTTTAAFDTATRELRITTPAARQYLLRTDAARRPVRIEAPGTTPVDLTYSAGLLSMVTSGSRQYTYGYDAKRRLTSVTDPLLRQTTFTYDNADRVLTQTLPDQRVITFTYDAAGNIT